MKIDHKRRMPEGRRFKPGQSGNPSGRPKGSGLLSKAYADELGKPHGNRTVAAAVAEKVVTAALAGNIQAAKELADRSEGKPNQPLEVSRPSVFTGTEEEQEAQFFELLVMTFRSRPGLLQRIQEQISEARPVRLALPAGDPQ